MAMGFGNRDIAQVNDTSYKPTYGQTAAAAFQQPFLQVKQIADYVLPGLSTEDSRRKTASDIANINEALNDPRQSFFQQASNAVSGIAGGLIPTLPTGLIGGAVLKGAAGVVGFGARKVALAAAAEAGSDALLTAYTASQVPLAKLAQGPLSHFLPEASIAGIAAGTAEGYGFYKGMTIPEHFSENYNAIQNTLDKEHAIEDWGSDNYGFLLGAVPFAAGYVAFKGVRGVVKYRNAQADSKALDAELGRLLREHHATATEREAQQAKVSELQDHLQQAEDLGYITPEMHEWYLSYLENPNDLEKVHEGGLNVLKSLQIPYDRITGRVWNQVLSRDGVKNLQAATFDQSVTNLSDEERQLLSSYITHNELDGYVANMKENPNMLMGLQGFTHGLGARIEAHSMALRDLEHALMRNLPKGLLKKQIFSQNNVYQHLKKLQESTKTGIVPRDVPYHVPKQVAYKLKLAHQIKKIKARKTRQYQLKYEKGEHLKLAKKLKELKLIHPAEEMAQIKETLMPNGALRKDFKTRTAYYRLEDLSQVWPQARVLLDRIHGEAINEKQKGLNQMLKQFIDMVDNNASRLADPDAVKRYLHSRLEQSVPSIKGFESSGIGVETGEIVKETPSITPEVLDNEAITQRIETTLFEFAKEEYNLSKKKYKQFTENAKALADLIECALGG